MKKLLISFWGHYNWTILGVISIHFSFFFKDQGTEWEYFWGITKFQVWGVCLIFLFFLRGGGGGGGGVSKQMMLGPSLGVKKN